MVVPTMPRTVPLGAERGLFAPSAELQRAADAHDAALAGDTPAAQVIGVLRSSNGIVPSGPVATLPPPHTVVLEPGPPPSSDESAAKAMEKLTEQVLPVLREDETLLVVADEGIWRRLARHPIPRVLPILGAWHANAVVMRAAIVAFSGFGLFQMAQVLGVEFLDKLEEAVDFRATAAVLRLILVSIGRARSQARTALPSRPASDRVERVLALQQQLLTWWHLHLLAIRRGNGQLQLDALAALTPLFAVSGAASAGRRRASCLRS
jgi:hypothetical protein